MDGLVEQAGWVLTELGKGALAIAAVLALVWLTSALEKKR